MIKKYKDYIILLIVFLIIIFSSNINSFLMSLDNNLDITSINNNYCESLERDYNDLLSIHDFSLASNFNLVVSKVYLRNIYEFTETVSIYKGSNDDLDVGLAVINDAGLVGVIKDVDTSSSRVTLLTSKNSNISVKVNEAYGILKYQSGKLIVSNLSSNTNMAVGDKIYTSGIGNLPGDILVGEVSKIDLNNTEIEKIITVKPAVDFENINYVMVVV